MDDHYYRKKVKRSRKLEKVAMEKKRKKKEGTDR